MILDKLQKHWLDFTWELTLREIKVRYKNALFGFLWMILNPVLQMLIIGTIFQFFVPIDVDNYFVFLFLGIFIWNFFSTSLSKAVGIFVNERGLLQKANFPRESLPISVILANLFHVFVGLLLFAVFFAKWQWQVLYIVPILLWLSFFMIGLSLFFASLNVKFRDIYFFVGILLSVWFYATPILYSLDLVPQKIESILVFNPLTLIIEGVRYSLLGLSIENFWPKFLINILVVFITFLIGVFVFLKEKKYFDDWM